MDICKKLYRLSLPAIHWGVTHVRNQSSTFPCHKSSQGWTACCAVLWQAAIGDTPSIFL